MSPTPKAVRVKTASGWQDIALQGAQGPPGRTPSAKAQSSISFAAADGYYRGIPLNFTTIVFDDFGNSFSPANYFTCRESGRYLIGGSYEAMANAGEAGISLFGKNKAGILRSGPDSNKWGTQSWILGNLTAGAQLSLAGYHTGGGSGVFTLEVIKLDSVGPHSEEHYAGISPGRITGPADGLSTQFTCPPAFLLYMDNAGAVPCEFTVTPSVDCWWEVAGFILARINAAAWGRLEMTFELTSTANVLKADALGQTITVITGAHHNGAQDWTQIQGKALWALTAGQTYKCRWMMNWCQGAYLWQIYRDRNHLQFLNLGARPRY